MPPRMPAGRPPAREPLPDDRPTEVVEPIADPVPAAGPPQVEPQRVVDPVHDEVGEDGKPGRHRRRAGASPNSYPASAYLPKASSSGKKPRPSRRRKTAFWKELPLLVVIALLLTFLIQTFLARVYEIPSGSMETTLHGCVGCTNDRVLVDKISYRFHDPQPGDVVVFRGPDSWTNTEFTVAEPSGVVQTVFSQLGSLVGLAPPDEKDFVKRVIAVGGQTVSCCDTRNRVMVDGKPLDESYIYYLPEAGPARQIPFGPVTVPQGELWVMGDSRNNSADSRVTGHGPIPVENVIGQARLIVLPVNRFGLVPQTDPQQTQALGALGAGVPAALGLLGTLPLALARRRRLRFADDEFLPAGPPSPGRPVR